MMPEGGGRLLLRATSVASPKVHRPATLQAASASANSAPDGYRDSGSLFRARRTMASRSLGNARPSTEEGATAGSWTCAKKSAAALSATKGGRPHKRK